MTPPVVRAVRRAMRDRQGVMREAPIERLRHVMRREAERAARSRRDNWA